MYRVVYQAPSPVAKLAFRGPPAPVSMGLAVVFPSDEFVSPSARDT